MVLQRVILFRGKRTDNGQWVYGIPASFRKIDNVVRATMIPEIDGEHCMSECVCVDPDTVGQYTGQCDGNWKRIFEGDIVAGFDPDTGRTEAVGSPVVYFGAGFCTKYPGNTPPRYHVLERRDCEYLAVIGNIHDNPEMLSA